MAVALTEGNSGAETGVAAVSARVEGSEANRIPVHKDSESFGKWPGMEGKIVAKKHKSGSKQKHSRTRDQCLPSAEDGDDLVQVEESTLQKHVSTSLDMQPRYRDLPARNVDEGRRLDSHGGAPQPSEGGYRSGDMERWSDSS